MKDLHITKVDFPSEGSAAQVPAVLDQYQVPFQPVTCVNWEEFPYQPAMRFRIAHAGKSILLDYEVTEKSVRAVAESDNGRVWEDSCAEFFVQLPGDAPENYYNFECNCAGKLLIEYGKPGVRTHAPLEKVALVRRWASLGNEPFAERTGECTWRLALVIPVAAFFAHSLTSFNGMVARGNFYKCGDKLQTPHFLSWAPITLPKPMFHCPDFFGCLKFE